MGHNTTEEGEKTIRSLRCGFADFLEDHVTDEKFVSHECVWVDGLDGANDAIGWWEVYENSILPTPYDIEDILTVPVLDALWDTYKPSRQQLIADLRTLVLNTSALGYIRELVETCRDCDYVTQKQAFILMKNSSVVATKSSDSHHLEDTFKSSLIELDRVSDWDHCWLDGVAVQPMTGPTHDPSYDWVDTDEFFQSDDGRWLHKDTLIERDVVLDWRKFDKS